MFLAIALVTSYFRSCCYFHGDSPNHQELELESFLFLVDWRWKENLEKVVHWEQFVYQSLDKLWDKHLSIWKKGIGRLYFLKEHSWGNKYRIKLEKGMLCKCWGPS